MTPEFHQDLLVEQFHLELNKRGVFVKKTRRNVEHLSDPNHESPELPGFGDIFCFGRIPNY